MICRNDHCYASRAQKPHFCVKTTKNLRKIAHSDTTTPILCSKGRKMGVPKPKSAQKPRFCARPHRTARSGSAEHGTARSGQARQGTATRNGTRPPGTKRNGPKHNETQPLRNVTATQPPRNTIHETQPPRNTIHETQPLRQRQGTATQWHNKKGDNLSGCLL